MKCDRPVLLVEDDEVDALAVSRCFKKLKIKNRLLLATDGERALALLREEERPCLILLDLNMPRMSGLELLKEIKADPGLRAIPVVVFTSSKEEADRVESFKLGVSGYMIKPVEHEKFEEVIRTIDLYWTMSESPD